MVRRFRLVVRIVLLTWSGGLVAVPADGWVVSGVGPDGVVSVLEGPPCVNGWMSGRR